MNAKNFSKQVIKNIKDINLQDAKWGDVIHLTMGTLIARIGVGFDNVTIYFWDNGLNYCPRPRSVCKNTKTATIELKKFFKTC